MRKIQYKHNFTGRAMSEHLLDNIDKEFVDRVLLIDDVELVEIDRLNNETFNRYYIKIYEDSIKELVENKISEIYKDITSKYTNSNWDIIDTVYKNRSDLFGYKRNAFYWILKELVEDKNA